MEKKGTALLLIRITLISVLGASSACYAATTTANFQVTATVTASCSVAATTLAFGNYDPVTATEVNAQNNIVITCSNGIPWSAALSTGAAGIYTPRHMTDGAMGTLNYNIFKEANHTNIWGDGSGTTQTVTGTGTGVAQTEHGFGQIPAGQNTPPAGAYSDTITVTITY